MSGEAIEVQAVIPVRPADEGQAVGAQVGHGVADAPAQMLHKGLGKTFVIVKGHGLCENGKVPGLPDVGIGARDQPQGVVIKAGAYGQIPLFGKGLVLVVGAAVGELGGGNVQ